MKKASISFEECACCDLLTDNAECSVFLTSTLMISTQHNITLTLMVSFLRGYVFFVFCSQLTHNSSFPPNGDVRQRKKHNRGPRLHGTLPKYDPSEFHASRYTDEGEENS